MSLRRKIGCTFALLLALATTCTATEKASQSIRMEVIHGKPYVMVTVNERGPFRFLIDTGTGGEAMVTSELAGELNLPVIGHARLTDPSGLGKQRANVVQIQSLRVAGVNFNTTKAIVHRLSGQDGACQGLLGFPIFRDYLLTLDYPNQRMTLAAGALTADRERSVLPFRMPDGVPIAPLRIGGLRVEAQFDSGGTGLSLPQKIAARLKFFSGPVPFGNGESLSTRFQIKGAKLRANVRLGQYTFEQPFVEINTAFPLINMGSGPMEKFAITFDQVHLLVRLESKQKTLHLAATATSLRMGNAPTQKTPSPQLVPVG